MLNDQNDVAVEDVGEPPSPIVRDIHALSPPPPPPLPPINTVRPSYSSSLSTTTDGGDNFTTISREFNALVIAGSRIRTENETTTTMRRMGEELAINSGNSNSELDRLPPDVGVRMHEEVKKEEAESKIGAWENGKVAKINNRYKREDAIIKGWENQQVEDATSRMKRVERKLEEKRAKALEKMQNDIAKAHRKAEEKRASAEAKRGIKVAKVMEIANLMRAVGRPPSKRSVF